MTQHDGYRLLCQKLREVSDLDEGRRDLAGILARSAALVRDVLGTPMAYAAAAVDGASLASFAEEGALLVRTDPWEGPGRLGRMVLQDESTQAWLPGGGDPPSIQDFLGVVGARSWLGTPIPLPDRPAGLLVVIDSAEREFGEEERELVQLVASHCAGAIGNLRAFQEVESLAITDELTRLYNYRFLKTALRREWGRVWC